VALGRDGFENWERCGGGVVRDRGHDFTATHFSDAAGAAPEVTSASTTDCSSSASSLVALLELSTSEELGQAEASEEDESELAARFLLSAVTEDRLAPTSVESTVVSCSDSESDAEDSLGAGASALAFFTRRAVDFSYGE
jgi:hypothetical protein